MTPPSVVFRFGTRAFVVVPFGVVVVLFGVLRFVLAMVGVVARVVKPLLGLFLFVLGWS
jgi:hypothetical protein